MSPKYLMETLLLIEKKANVLHPLFVCLILSGAHYRLVLIFRVYLVLPAFSAYQTFTLI